MNKSYCSIYNETTGTYVAVQETARAKGKRSSSSVAVCAASLLVASTMGLAAGDAVANSVTFNDQQVWGGSVNKSGVAYTNATPQGNLIASDTELNIPGATQEAGDPAGSIGEYIKQSILMGNGASFATVGGKYGIYDRFERVVAIGSKAAVAQPGDVFDVTVLGASAIAGSYDHRFNNGTQLPGAWTDTNSLRGATAIGGSAKALSSRATALGYQSEARGIGTIAIGSGAIAGVSATNNTGTGDVANAIAIGNASNASAASSVAIGREAQAIGESTVAIGSIAGKNALGAKSVLIGYESGLDSASGNSVYIGDGAGRGQKADPRGNIGSSSLPGHNVGIGHWTLYNSTGEGNTALGLRAGREQKGSDNTHIGAFAGYLQDGDYNVNAGYFAGQKSKGEKNLNLGIEAGASHTGSSSVSLGDSANKGTTSERSVAIGRSSASTGNDSIALGSQAIAGNAVWDSVGGKYSASTALNDIAIGTASKAAGGNSIALGTSATVSGAKSIAIGYGNEVKGAGSGAIGVPSRIDGNASYAMGNDNVVGTGSNNVFILGNNVNIGATAVQRDANGIVTGYTLANTAPGAVALGHNTGVTVAGGVALGESSKATTDKGVVGLNTATGAASTVTSPTWKSTLAAVSVGNGSTATRQITGVAAGFNDTDAVNVAKLKAGQVHYLSVNDGGVQGTNYANDGATKDGAIAIGKNATASYENAISIGNTRNVSKDSIAIGNGISSFFGAGSKNILIGNASGIYSTNSGIIGNNSAIYNLKYGEPTNNAGSYIIGNNSGVGRNTDDAFIIGNNVTIGTAKTVFASPNSISGGGAPVNGAVALGSNTTVTAAGAVALGKGSKATTDKDVVGFNTVTGTVADTKVSPFDTNSWKSTHAAVSIGDGTTVTRQLTGLAAGTQDTDAVNVAQLKNSQIHFFSVNSTGVTDGNYSNNGAQGADSIAIGKNALTKTTDAVVIGRGATTSVGTRDSQGNVVVIGAQAKTISQNAVVIGQGAEIYDDVLNLHDSVAIGAGAKISGFAQESIAIGSGSKANLAHSTVVGQAASSTGQGGSALGYKAIASGINATALGANSEASLGGSVALGAGSTTTAAQATAAAAIGGITYAGFAGSAPATGDVVSVGDGTKKRQIQNVAAGQITATSTDAINGSQLYATNKVLGTVASSTKSILGGNAALAPNGTLSMSNIGGTGKDTVDEAISAVAGSTKSPITFVDDIGGQIEVALGNSLNIQGGSTADLSDGNIGVVADSTTNTLTVKLAKELAGLTSVTTGNTTINDNGLTITGGPSVTTTGINAGSKVITNVADGKNASDAVNFAQLQAVVAGSASKSVVAAGTNVASVTKTAGAAGQDIYTVNADATSVEAGSTAVTVTPGAKDASNVTKYNVDLSAQTKKDIADGAEAADVVAKKGLTFAGDNSSTSDAIKLGETLAITGDSNITTEAAGTGLQVKLNTELKDLTSVTTTDTAGNKTVTNGSGITITPAGGNAVSLTTAGLDNGGNTITNVGSAGTLNATNSNAATGADVYNAIHGTDGLLDTATFGLKAQDNSTVTKKLNNTVSVVGGHTGAGTTSAKNIKTVINATGELEIQMAETPEFASVTVGATGAQTQLSSTGANQLQIGSTGAKPITVNAATGVITGLSNTTWNGTATTGRAATEDQLQAVHDAAKATADAAVQYDAKAGGGINKNSVTLAGTTGTAVTKNANGTFTDMSGGTALNNVASAGSISDVNNAYKAVNAGDLNNQVAGLTSKGLKFAANSGTDYTAALGSTVSVKGAAANTDADKFDAGKNIMTSVDASGNILVAMAKDLKANSVTVGATGAQTQLSSTGANQLQIGSTGAKPITVDAATGVITGLSNTTWNGTATTGRAATEDQLQAVHDAAKATADAAVQYDTAGGVVNKDSVTLAGTTGTAVTPNADGTFTSMSGGTALNNVASAGDISDVNNAYKAVNAGDLNNQVAGLTSKGLKFTANNGTVHTAALGSTISVKGAAANTDADKFDAGKNIMTSVDASGNILVAMAKDLKADSVSTGATTINNDGLTITGGPSVTTTGINAGSKAITNVADGTVAADSKDAVTGGQLYGTADSVKTILGGNAALGADGKLTMSNIGGTGKGTIDEAVKAAYDKAGEAADAAKKHTTVVAGQNVTVTEGTNADGGKEYTVAVKDDIELTSVTTGATKMDTTGVTIKNADPAKTVSLTADGLNNGGNKITNVADGAVAANSKDAVTGGQLYSTNTQVAGNTAALGGGAKFDSASNTFTAPVYNVTDANGNAKVVNDVGSAIEALNQGFKVTSAATGSGTVSGTATTAVKSGSTMTYVAGDNIALTQDGMKFTIATNKNVNFDKVTVGDVVLDKDNGIDAGNKQITNVGDGVNPGDAVNKKQLEAAINGNKEGLNALQQQIGQVSADANAGAASAMATAGLPQAYTPGKSMIAAAGSVYKGATAQAIGISTITENGKWVFKGSVNVNNRGYAGATVGVGYQW